MATSAGCVAVRPRGRKSAEITIYFTAQVLGMYCNTAILWLPPAASSAFITPVGNALLQRLVNTTCRPRSARCRLHGQKYSIGIANRSGLGPYAQPFRCARQTNLAFAEQIARGGQRNKERKDDGKKASKNPGKRSEEEKKNNKRPKKSYNAHLTATLNMAN